MLRGLTTVLLIVILPTLAAQANAAERPMLAKIIVNRESVVGELLERMDKHVRILEISTNELRTISADEIKSIRVDISEEEAALSVGLPEYLSWNIRRLTPTTGVNTVVVLPLCNASGQQTLEGRRFAENVTTELVRNDVRVVERTLLSKILGELALQNSRGFDTAVAQKVGKQLGAFVVLTGTIVQKRKGYVAQLRLIKVETGEILFAATHRMPDITSKPQVVKSVQPPIVMPPAKPQERRPVPQKKKQAPPSSTKSLALSNEGIITNSIGMKLKLIPAGEFLMGSAESPALLAKEYDSELEYFAVEHPQHRVRITKPFYLGVHEVTQEQWKRVMGSRPWSGEKRVKEGADYAAMFIGWGDAMEFCRKLSSKEGQTYHLPTEAQWEYACRAGTTTRYSFGDDASDLSSYAWFAENTRGVGKEYAHRVGQKRANPWGLHDMHGNVSEWCQDWFAEDYFEKSQTEDPAGPNTGSFHVFRGGSWVNPPRNCRSADRHGARTDYWTNLGFRVALVPPK